MKKIAFIILFYLFFPFSFSIEKKNKVSEIDFSDIPAEREALIDLWYSTNGSAWYQTCINPIDNIGCWNSKESICTWFGVQCISTSSNQTSVSSLNLELNNLMGSVPQSIGNLTNLNQILFSENILSGSIPKSIGNLINLKELHLDYNSLSGTIPESIGNLKNLEILDLSLNHLTGFIPESIGNLTELKKLYLKNNKLSGPIPETIGNLINLEIAVLSNNNFIEIIPESIGNLTKLQQLYLSLNNLTGPIPDSIEKLINLEFFYLNQNHLSGSIPESICKLISLIVLNLSKNKLTGFIPECIGNLTNLEQISLTDNNLIGSIPETIGNLTNLEQLSLSNNNLTGSIPRTTENLSNLQYLYLNNNNFSGCSFVFQSNIFIDYSFNQFTSINFVNSTSLQLFDISNNFITQVPTLLQSNVDFLLFDFDNNLILNIDQFLASIFQSYSFIKVLVIYLQNNSLIEFPSPFCKIVLEYSYIDLSNNIDMVGYIPSSCSKNSAELNFQFLSIKNNEKMKDSSKSGINWSFDKNSITQIENYFCYRSYFSEMKRTELELPVSYFNYSNCYCKSDSFGIPPYHCIDCTKALNYCNDIKSLTTYGKCYGNFFNISLDYYIQVKNNRICLLNCENDVCNPNKNCTISMNNITNEFYLNSCEPCAEGYEDRLCSKCIFNSNAQYYQEHSKCIKCESNQIPFLISIILSIAFLLAFLTTEGKLCFILEGIVILISILLVFSIQLNELIVRGFVSIICVQLLIYDQNFGQNDQSTSYQLIQDENEFPTQQITEYQLASTLQFVKLEFKKCIPSFLKILIFYVQTNIALNSSFFNSSDSSNILALFYFSELRMSGLECSFPPLVPGIYRFLFFLILPIPFILFVNLLFGLKNLYSKFKSYLCFQICHRARSVHLSSLNFGSEISFDFGGSNFFDDSIKIWLFLFYTFYFDLSSLILQLLAITKDKFEDNYYLSSYPWIQFDLDNQGTYFKIFCMAIGFAVLYIFMIPLLFAFITIKFKTKREVWMGFFTKNYETNCWWYEFVWLLRRLTVAIAFVIPSSFTWKLTLISITLLAFLNVQWYLQPFKQKLDNLIDSLGVCLIIVTYSLNYQETEQSIRSTLMFLNIIFLLFLPIILFSRILSPLFLKIKYVLGL